MGDETRCKCFKSQIAEDDKIVDIYSNRLCAREGESSDQQGSFMQSTGSEQVSAVSTPERAHCVDISHDNCSHPKLAVI